jgi:hypothetical protein
LKYRSRKRREGLDLSRLPLGKFQVPQPPLNSVAQQHIVDAPILVQLFKINSIQLGARPSLKVPGGTAAPQVRFPTCDKLTQVTLLGR